jgi:hypothetical protein
VTTSTLLGLAEDIVISIVVFLVVSLRNTAGTVFQGANSLRPQGEVFGNDDILHVASPDDCGEFHNEDGDHSGKYFVKYQFFDGDDYLDENVYVIQ